MGTEDSVEVDRSATSEEKAVDILTPPELELPEYPTSNLHLLTLGAAFFALWAGSSSSVLQTATVLPVIQKEFGISKSEVQWVAASRLFSNRRWTMLRYLRSETDVPLWNDSLDPLQYLVDFYAASLNICRAFFGLGSSVAMPAAAGMIGTMFPPGRKRTYAFVAVSCGGAGGASFGMLIAGAFVEYTRWTWRPCYLVGGLIFFWPWATVAWLVPADPPQDKASKLDWLGSLLMGISLFLLLFGFTSSQTESKGWRTPYVPVLIVCSGLFMICFVLRQVQLTKAAGTKASPLIPRALLSMECWYLLMVYLATMLAWAGTDTFWTLMAYLYLDGLGLGALRASLQLSVVVISGFTAAIIVGITIVRFPPRAVIGGLCGVSVISFILMAIRQLDWPFWRADLWALLLVAFNTDCLVAGGLTLVSLTAPIKDGSVATAIFQTSSKIGYALGLAIGTLILENIESKALRGGASPRDALARSLSAGFWFCGGCVAACSLVIIFGMRGWRMLSEMRQGGEESQESEDSNAVPRANVLA